MEKGAKWVNASKLWMVGPGSLGGIGSDFVESQETTA